MQNNTRIRQQAILDIIQEKPVFNQEELARHLKETGIIATQATLSRDLRALKITKVPGEGYVSPAHGRRPALVADFSSGILRIQFSGQLGIIRTLPGLANAVASLIDHQDGLPVIGTIAGDDTILLVLRADATPDATVAALTPLFPEIKTKLIP